ncbi:MAG: 2-phosphosulfolactate phosphatase, partial [Chloroflexi bacterium]|nr:2-phosphosulfolactate phosphatase [Chloroflexota bacterium]
YAFAAGARDIVLVSTVEEALALRERTPGALIMGEVNGLPVEGFDFGNSPSALIGRDLAGRRLIQRTSAGTQGVMYCTQAETLLASSFVCASPTARYIKQHSPASVTFVITGFASGWDGDEDAACADYIAALLRGEAPNVAPFIQRVYDSQAGRTLADPATLEYLRADLECCVKVDLFDFAMLVERRDGLPVMQAVRLVPLPPASLQLPYPVLPETGTVVAGYEEGAVRWVLPRSQYAIDGEITHSGGNSIRWTNSGDEPVFPALRRVLKDDGKALDAVAGKSYRVLLSGRPFRQAWLHGNRLVR